MLLILLLCLSGAEFLIRGPLRALPTSDTINDFLSPYIQGRAWLLGQDPYDPQVLPQLWPPDAGHPGYLGKSEALASRYGIPSPYPLTGFPLLAPLSVLHWHTANLVWIGMILGSSALAVTSVGKIAGLSPQSMAFGWLGVAALALAPIQTGIATENPALPVFALAVAAIWCSETEHRVLAAVLLASALALKPTVAMPVLVYLLIRRQWRVTVPAVTGAGLLLLLADLRLAAAGTTWVPSFLRISRKMFGPGGVDDFSSANSLRFNLVNLQVVTYQLLGQRGAAQIAAWGVFSLLFGFWLWSLWKSRARRPIGLLDLSVLVTTMLLPFYHRAYDAVVLLLPVAWAIANFYGWARYYARTCLGLAAVFLAPGPALLESLWLSGGSGARTSHLRWWNLLALSHEVWAMLLLSIVLLVARWKANSRQVEAVLADF